MGSDLRNRVVELLKAYQGKYIPQSFIHRAVNASKSRVSEILGDLEKQGLITRITVGRSKLVYVHPGLGERTAETPVKRIRLGIVYSSEYLFLGGFTKRLERSGIGVEVIVFRDGARTTLALAGGFIDIALSPLPGQLYLYPAYRTYSIVLKGLKGGFRVLSAGEGDGLIYSSMLSTMDYIRHLILSKKLVQAEGTVYFRDPAEILGRNLKRGVVVVWHPVYLELEKKGFKRLYSHEELDIGFCCTLAVSNTLGTRLSEKIVKAYTESIEEFRRDPGKWVEYYSSLTGIDTRILKQAVNEYKIADDLDPRVVDKIVKALSPAIPSAEAYREAIFTES
ncbi:DUF7343 domain-containing protein [Thermogladius sp. 4427co]|uniref:DUF7343 domain-containing protein n=1 Tax=Thermogladius sp. 4427co TaxID=3450718 RepID=UPI003F78D5B5